MQTYDIGLVPGPVSVPPELRAAYQINYGSADLEDEFLRLYQRCETHLGKILATRNRVVIKTGSIFMPFYLSRLLVRVRS